MAYIDDIGGAETEKLAHLAFETLRAILIEISLWESMGKACKHSRVMIFWGLKMDTVKMTIELDEERLKEISSILQAWSRKRKHPSKKCKAW